jgi:phosphatidylserine/phosphatidylglycerophosphate/cardiolipin synthase-like enzyme
MAISMKKVISGIVTAAMICTVSFGFTANAVRVAPKAVSATAGTVEYYFPRAGQAPAPVLISLIKSAKYSVDMAIYSFTDTNIANALVADKKRGITVRVISDKTEAKTKYQKALLATLKKAGIPVKINTHSGLMHLKATIIDKATATTGSFNYTKGAETKNDEVFVVLKNATIAKGFDSEFVTMWNDSGHYKNY